MSGSIDQGRLGPFFNPRRIAVVGASERGMYPAGILRNLLDHGFEGEIYPVNPNRQNVFGLPCYADVTATPRPVDLAILVIPRQVILPALHQCRVAGIPAALIITAGFAEADDEGRGLQARLVDFLHSQGSSLQGEEGAGRPAVIGPNCAGLANIPGRVIATRLPAPPRSGPISFVSQSGALMMALYGVFADRHIGLSKLLSLGNQVDVGLAESLGYLAADPQTRVIGAFVEGVGDGPGFVDAARRALAAGKPMVLVKVGRTAGGRQAAQTHTAALTGSDRVFDAVCRQFGVTRVDDVDDLVTTVEIMALVGRRLDRRANIAIVTQSGGLGSLTADLCELAGLHLPPLSDRVQAHLRALPEILDFGALGNPADVRGAAVIGAATRATLKPFLEDPDSDVVVLLLAKSAVREQDAVTAAAIVEAAQDSDKPLIVVWVGQRYPVGEVGWSPGHRLLGEAGIPVFEQPGQAVRALARAADYGRFRSRGDRQKGDGGRA